MKKMKEDAMKGMSDARYRMALVRMRDRIAAGLKLHRDDSNTTGDKYTRCSWGMCSNDVEQWPNAGDHLFPVDFMRNGRIAISRQDHQTCPLQDNAEIGGPSWGCFYRCCAFQPKQPTGLTREEVLQLYDQRIAAVGELPEVCACDGTGVVVDPVGGKKTLPCPDCTVDLESSGTGSRRGQIDDCDTTP